MPTIEDFERQRKFRKRIYIAIAWIAMTVMCLGIGWLISQLQTPV